MSNNVAKEINNGFQALAGGLKEAGRNRIEELVKKQGYVGYRNPEAIKAFREDPNYKGWKCVEVDGEYRFSPPENQEEKTSSIEQNDVISIKEKYKEQREKFNETYMIIQISAEDPKKCEYRLLTRNPKTGQQIELQKETLEANQEFWMKLLPSLYYNFCNGIPVIDHEKEKNINFLTPDGKHAMMIGNLPQDKKELVKAMKKYVDDQLNFNVEGNRNIKKQ